MWLLNSLKSYQKTILIFGIICIVALLLLAIGLYSFLKPGAVNDARLEETITGMENTVNELNAGNISQAEKTFNEVHGFFHDVDPPLREKDPKLAKDLWDAVVIIEAQFGSYKPDVVELINKSQGTITILKKAKKIL